MFRRHNSKKDPARGTGWRNANLAAMPEMADLEEDFYGQARLGRW